MDNVFHIRGGRLFDPLSGIDQVSDLYIRNGLIQASLPGSGAATLIDASGLTIVPGLIDLHVHLREPGGEESETVQSGSAAAARGGFTTVVAMPNTRPPCDTPEEVQATLKRARHTGLAHVLPSACITAGRQGIALADLDALACAGAVAFTDDGNTVADAGLMAEAMRKARRLGLPVMDHALDPALAGDGVIHEGSASRRLGLPGIPSSAEVRIVERDIDLCRQTGCAVHIQHISCAESVELIRRARKEGLHLSAEATPHHLALTDDDIPGNDANFKMNPPLGSAGDRDAILSALIDGTIRAFATDHAPHAADFKAKGFLSAPFGVVGLETAVGVTYTLLVESGRMPLADWLKCWTSGPAMVLGLPAPSLSPGSPADLAILDLHTEWTVEPGTFASRSTNTPFTGWRLFGRSVCTFASGRNTWDGRS